MKHTQLDMLALDSQLPPCDSTAPAAYGPGFLSQLVSSKAFKRVLKVSAMHRSLYVLTVCSPHRRLKAVVNAAKQLDNLLPLHALLCLSIYRQDHVMLKGSLGVTADIGGAVVGRRT